MKYNLKFKFENPRLGDIGGKKGAHQNDSIFWLSHGHSLYARAYYIIHI